MKKFIFFAILSFVICLTRGEGEKSQVPPEPVPINNSTEEATSISISRKTTTSTTTSTTPPSTSTTSSTTPATTTTMITTTAPTNKPTSKPIPKVHQWTLNYSGTNETCIIMKLSLEIHVSYETNDNKTASATILMPSNATAVGACEKNETVQNLTLIWLPNNEETFNTTDFVTFIFTKNDTLKKFMLSSIITELIPEKYNFPMIKSNATIKASHIKEELKTPLSMSYRCKQAETFNFTDENILGNFVISDLQMEAFYSKNGIAFDSAKDCESASTPGIVPIAVGCSLVALIIIVLVAYLIGRKRSQARGYLSM